MNKKINECPECQNIEDDQYTCTTCWCTGGIFMYAERDDDGNIIDNDPTEEVINEET